MDIQGSGVYNNRPTLASVELRKSKNLTLFEDWAAHLLINWEGRNPPPIRAKVSESLSEKQANLNKIVENIRCDWCKRVCLTKHPRTRKGPEEYPVLCNACGIQFQKKGDIQLITRKKEAK